MILGILLIVQKLKFCLLIKPKYEKFEGQIFETTVGRILFNNILPETFLS